MSVFFHYPCHLSCLVFGVSSIYLPVFVIPDHALYQYLYIIIIIIINVVGGYRP